VTIVTDSRPEPELADDSPEFHLPPDHWPLPELTTFEQHPHPATNRYVAMRDSADYQKLRKTFTNFAFPIVVAVLAIYFVYVLLSIYGTGLMKTPGWGGLNLGLWLSLAQFPITWIATWAYIRHANGKLDPLAAEIRTKLEAEEA
jgi:uncharacterized membrane protein (DUF485 family)